jgi:hypothetical protein
MAVNATGVFFGIKHAVPPMIANGGGSIVNLSSIAGIIGSEHVHMAYNASKAAVRLMTKSVAVQHAKDKIRANSVLLPRKSGRPPCPRRVSTTPASLPIVVHFAEPMLQAFALFTVAGRIRQTIAQLMFSVSEPLAVFPALPIVALVSPRLRGHPRDLRNWDLHVRLPRRRTLGISRHFREGAGEQDRHTCSKAEFRHSYSPISTIADPGGDFPSTCLLSKHGCIQHGS